MSVHHNHLSDQQFMHVSTLMSLPINRWEMTVDDTDDKEDFSKHLFWHRKSQEAARSGITDSIREHGVKFPVVMGESLESNEGLQIQDGYHRVAAVHSLNPRMFVPITYYDDHDDTHSGLPTHSDRENEIELNP